MDISSRHLPDLSAEVPAAHDFSDASFQIPLTSKSPSKLLFAEDGLDFLAGTDDTLASPSVPTTARNEDSMAIDNAENTPRSRRRTTRSFLKPETPLRRSPRKKPAIPSPLKEVVASDLSTALQDTISPFKRQRDFSFQIPKIGRQAMDLLMDVDGGSFLGKGVNATFEEEPSTPRAREPLTLSQLSPAPSTTRSPLPAEVAPIDAHSQASADQNTPSPHSDHRRPPPSLGGCPPQDISYARLRAEIEALNDDHGEIEESDGQSSSQLPLATVTIPDARDTECADDSTKHAYHASDAFEKQSMSPPNDVAARTPPDLDGPMTGTILEHDQDAIPTSVCLIIPLLSYYVDRVPDLRYYLALL